MTIGIAQAALDLGVAAALGAAIGFEHQWRQRLAGLRTNTLVALGGLVGRAPIGCHIGADCGAAESGTVGHGGPLAG